MCACVRVCARVCAHLDDIHSWHGLIKEVKHSGGAESGRFLAHPLLRC